jgi:hypothetical protein
MGTVKLQRTFPVLAAGTLLLMSTLTSADPPPDKVKKLIGDKAAGILDGATSVEVFRIQSERTDKKGDKYIAGYPITSKGKKQGKEFAAKMIKALYDEKTYTGQSARCYQPGVAFRIWHGKDAVEIIICFKCTNFEIAVMGEDPITELQMFGFGPKLEPFLALAREALPDDNEIQSLK